MSAFYQVNAYLPGVGGCVVAGVVGSGVVGSGGTELVGRFAQRKFVNTMSSRAISPIFPLPLTASKTI